MKKLNEAAMQSELSGSAFFNSSLPASKLQTRGTDPSPDQVTGRPSASPEARPYDATTEQPAVRTPVRRVINRYAFEFYQDQVEQLRRLSLDQKIRGEDGSMSEMVREALDVYLAGRGEAGK